MVSIKGLNISLGNVTLAFLALSFVGAATPAFPPTLSSSAPPPPKRNQFNILVTDYDQTLSAKDTTSIVGDVVERARGPDNQIIISSGDQNGNGKVVGNMDYFSDEYNKDYEQFQKKYDQIFEDRLKQGQKWKKDWLYEYSDAISSVEVASIKRMEKYGFLAGATHQQFYDGGAKNATLQNNSVYALSKIWDINHQHHHDKKQPGNSCKGPAKKNNDVVDPVYVLSVNWSKDLMQGSLETTFNKLRSTFETPSSGLRIKHINRVEKSLKALPYSNPDVEFDPATGKSTGKISRDLFTGVDKLNEFRRIRGQYQKKLGITNADKDNNSPDLKFAYAGDSTTDLLCILEPQVIGILVGNSTSVRTWLDRLQVPLVPFAVLNSDMMCKNKCVYQLDDWANVPHFFAPKH
ncbi:hypothetical protein H4219_004155 [Mycoemilia scoparia]|uniref:Uncharacterized protein n=1 Tax=Mycoemilia scoparia TaxID=417184 RepID=A0A9W8DN93_9FUNG|nr:hypothetical protein H4219_004155 [Mycoemilia scoparia]